MNDYDAQTLARFFQVSERAVQYRAAREGWQSVPRKGRGGGKLWLVESMPEATRIELASRLAAQGQGGTGAGGAGGAAASIYKDVTANQTGAIGQRGGAAPNARAQARAEVLLCFSLFLRTCGLSRTKAQELFAAAYNAGTVDVSAQTRAALPQLTRGSLRNWEKCAAAAGVQALGGAYGHRKGSGCIDSQPQVRELMLGMLTEFPHVSAELVREGIATLARDDAGVRVPSLRRVQTWIQTWKQENPQLALYLRAPDRWRGQFMAACGSMYELVTRYNQRWEYDGTPSDILLNDGKRYAIVGIINVYSRELLLEVAERSTGSVVANVTRTALLEWGVPEEVVTDNGKEFVGTQMQGLLLDLGIMPTILPPFRPDLKPAIERVFRTFSHHLLTLCPCYVGHNVATRQEIRERTTFAKRLMEHGGEDVSMAISPEELQAFCDDWCKSVYAHRPHSGLKGRTPYAVRQAWTGEVRRIEDPRALDVLLTPLVGNGGWRTVGKKGVRAGADVYDHAALGPHAGERVQVRVNPKDVECAYIFGEDGGFICEAVNMTHVATEKQRELALEKRRTQKAALTAQRKEMRGYAKAVDAAHIGERIMDMHKARAAAIEATAPVSTTEVVTHSTPQIESATRAARLAAGKAPQQHGEDLRERATRALQQATATMWTPPQGNPRAQVAMCDSILERISNGETVPQEQVEWAQSFASSNTYAGFAMLKRMAAND